MKRKRHSDRTNTGAHTEANSNAIGRSAKESSNVGGVDTITQTDSGKSNYCGGNGNGNGNDNGNGDGVMGSSTGRLTSCLSCGAAFPSRNALFRHLRGTGADVCSGSKAQAQAQAQAVVRLERYIVLYGYDGSCFHGSQHNAVADEARYPTVEGTLIAAIIAAMTKHYNNYSYAHATSEEKDVTSGRETGTEIERLAHKMDGMTVKVAVTVQSRTSRTDRGVHALANVVYLKITSTFTPTKTATGRSKADSLPPSITEGEWLAAVQAELPQPPHRTVFVFSRFLDPNLTGTAGIDRDIARDMEKSSESSEIAASEKTSQKSQQKKSRKRKKAHAYPINVRNACRKREYHYYVPYRAVLTPEEYRTAQQQKPTCRTVWVCNLPETGTDAFKLLLLQWAQERLDNYRDIHSMSPIKIDRVEIPPGGGGTATFHLISHTGNTGTGHEDNTLPVPLHAASALAAALDGACLPLPLLLHADEEGMECAESNPNPYKKGLLAFVASDAVTIRAAHQRLRDTLKLLTGTRSFHNFCPYYACAGQMQSVRTVYRCRSKMTSGHLDHESGKAYAILTITGRSFLYHQIRKMVGLVLAVVSGVVPLKYMHFALSKDAELADTEVPLAPGGNLVLAGCHFKQSMFQLKASTDTADRLCSAGGNGKIDHTSTATGTRTGISTTSGALRVQWLKERIKAAVSSHAREAEFDAFLTEMKKGGTAARMHKALTAWQQGEREKERKMGK